MATSFDQLPSKLQGIRSPIVVTLDDANASLAQFQYALDVYGWTGDPSVFPGSYIARLKKPPLANTVATFNVAPLLKTLFTNRSRPDQFTTLSAANEMIINLGFKAGYEASGTTDYANATSAVSLITRGFSYFNEGINADIKDNALTSRTGTIYLREDGYEFLPVFWDTNVDVTGIGFESPDSNVEINLGAYIGSKASVSDSDNKAYYIPIGYNNAQDWSTNQLSGALDTLLSEGITAIYLFDEFDNELIRWNVETVCEPKYTDGTIYFVNKLGMWDWINVFKKNVKNLSRTSEEYMSVRNTYNSDQLQSELSTPEYQRFNTDGMETVRVTTGYQDEDLTTLVKELMLSESILLQIGTERPLPVNVEDTSKLLQTGVNDGITSYDIQFKYAFNTVSTLGV